MAGHVVGLRAGPRAQINSAGVDRFQQREQVLSEGLSNLDLDEETRRQALGTNRKD